MAKKFTASSDVLKPDSKFNSKLVSKFINCMMWGGKKSAAQDAFYSAMEIVTEKIKDVPPLEIFETAINNVKPTLEVRSKRVGGASYQVPMQVNPKRQQSLAFRWILASARGKKGKPMAQRLAAELSDAYNRTGGAMTMRENVHRMAEANKAFAHFAW
jgi:small subunit ribosomal protein S7